MPHLALILPAAGQSSRFGAGRNKLLENLEGESVVVRSLRAFADHPDVRAAVVATGDEAIGRAIAGRIGSRGRARLVFCPGGPTRAHSVRNALAVVPEEIEWVAVHDAARPLISRPLIDRTFAAAQEHGAAVPAMPLPWTIREAVGPLPAPALRTVRRDRLWAMQTPQIVRRAALAQAFARCPLPLEEVTDDVQLIELAGGDVWLVEGEEGNIKITTPLDLATARELLREAP
jgi:2-C-methyl-D-erythritol 4-phosphate cytidylyltransferase